MSFAFKNLTVTEAKKHLLEVVSDIEEAGERVSITKNGVPVTIMLSLDDYESLMETLEILASPAILKSLAKSKKQIQKKQLLDDDEVWN